MVQSLEFPDIEDLIATHLSAVLGVPTGTKTATVAPFLRVLRTGGPKATRVTDSPRVTLEAYHKLESGAITLLGRARRALDDLPGTELDGFAIKSVTELGGPANLPDPTTTAYRYTYSAVVQVRGKQPI